MALARVIITLKTTCRDQKTYKISTKNGKKSTDHIKRKFYFSLLLDSQACINYKLTIDTYAEYFMIANDVCEAFILPMYLVVYIPHPARKHIYRFKAPAIGCVVYCVRHTERKTNCGGSCWIYLRVNLSLGLACVFWSNVLSLNMPV